MGFGDILADKMVNFSRMARSPVVFSLKTCAGGLSTTPVQFWTETKRSNFGPPIAYLKSRVFRSSVTTLDLEVTTLDLEVTTSREYQRALKKCHSRVGEKEKEEEEEELPPVCNCRGVVRLTDLAEKL